MGADTQKYIRKPLYVDAVRVNANNFDDLVAWCNGEVQVDETPGSGTTKKFIKVRVHNPKNPRQTKAFIGDWLLYTERGYKVYTNRAFRQAFDSTTEEAGGTSAEVPRDNADNPVGSAKERTNGQEIPKFYFAPHSDELTETKPHKNAVPLTLPELMNIVRNELVGEELENTTRPEEEPRKEPLPPQPKRVGSNVEIHDKRPESAVEEHGAATGADAEFEGVTPAPVTEIVPATPETIAQAVEENEQARAAEETVDEIIENHPNGPIAGMSEAAGESPRTELDDAHKGKRVLSEREQQVLGPDQVREMVRAGDVILAQDLEEQRA